MKLDRNINRDGLGKYAILNLRKLAEFRSGTFEHLSPEIATAIKTLEENGILDWGRVGSESEFFLIKLKDRYAEAALVAYSDAAFDDGDKEYAAEIADMSRRAGPNHPRCKKPD